jgi:hypothetical protein
MSDGTAHRKPSLQEANAELRRRLAAPWNIRFSNHAATRGLQRHFDIQDAIFVLENGVITDARYNERAGAWTYSVPGEDVEGDELTIVIAFEGDAIIVIVTGR